MLSQDEFYCMFDRGSSFEVCTHGATFFSAMTFITVLTSSIGPWHMAVVGGHGPEGWSL